MAKLLKESAITQFNEQGYYSPVPALSPSEAEHCRQSYEAFEQHQGGKLSGQLRNKPHLFLTWLDELIRHPKVLDAVEDLIGPNILVYHAQFFVKEPHTPDFVSFHQDTAYWSLSEAQGLSCWVAFADADLESGCMDVVPESHKQSLSHVERRSKDNMLWRGQTVDADLSKAPVASMPLKAGEMSIHHARIIHGSGPNKSNRRRIGYSIRYIPTHIARVGPRDSAMLVRGVDKYGNFDAEPRPKADYDPAAVALHKTVTDRYMEHYMTAPQEKEMRRA